MDNRRLPPLPSSDGDSLVRSRTAHDFWEGNEINRINETPFQKCDHQFIHTSEGVECSRCHFGMLGKFEIRNSKLFHKGTEIKM